MVWIFAGFGLIVGFITGISIVGLLYFKPLEVLPDIYYDTAISARLDHESVIFLFLGSITLIFVLARKLFSFFPSKMLAHYLKQY